MAIGNLLLYLLALGIGFGIQLLLRWSPWIGLALSFLIVVLISPLWSLGLLGGLWIACAFFTYQPEIETPIGSNPESGWYKIFLYAMLAFAGFLISLIFIWKLKVTTNLGLPVRELFAWSLLVLIEACFYKIVAIISVKNNRILIGYAMAILNFLMLLYWLYHLDRYLVIMIFITMIIVNPLLLYFVDRPLGRPQDPFFRRK